MKSGAGDSADVRTRWGNWSGDTKVTIKYPPLLDDGDGHVCYYLSLPLHVTPCVYFCCLFVLNFVFVNVITVVMSVCV